jgi:hypothetical protein
MRIKQTGYPCPPTAAADYTQVNFRVGIETANMLGFDYRKRQSRRTGASNELFTTEASCFSDIL